MQQREIKYIYIGEDRTSEALNSMAVSAVNADMALESLEDDLQGVAAGGAEGVQAFLNLADSLQAMTDEAFRNSGQIGSQIEIYDKLIDVFEDNVDATELLLTARSKLRKELDETEKAESEVAKTTGKSASIIQSFGFSLRDAESFQDGFGKGLEKISGGAGDLLIEFQGLVKEEGTVKKALKSIKGSLVGPVGVSLAITAVTTALVLLQDAFGDTSEASTKTADDLETEFAGLIKIVDAVQGSFEFTFKELEERQGPAQQAVDETSARIDVLQKKIDDLVSVSAPQDILGLRRDELKEAQALLEEQTQEIAAINAELVEEQELRDRIAFLEERGFKFAEKKTEETKSGTTSTKEELSVLEEIQAKRDILLGTISVTNEGELRTLTLLEEEVKSLEEQIEVRKRLFIEEQRQKQARQLASRFGEPAFGDEALGDTTIPTLPVDAVDTSILPDGLSDETISEVEAIARSIDEDLTDSVQGFIDLSDDLGITIQDSLAGGLAAFGEGLGDIIDGSKKFSSLGSAVLSTLADLGTRIGAQLIAFGVAGIAIKRFVIAPGAAIAAGVGLIALSRALKSSVSSSVSETVGGGGAGFRTATGPSFDDSPTLNILPFNPDSPTKQDPPPSPAQPAPATGPEFEPQPFEFEPVSVTVEPLTFDPISVNVAPVTVDPLVFEVPPVSVEVAPVTVAPITVDPLVFEVPPVSVDPISVEVAPVTVAPITVDPLPAPKENEFDPQSFVFEPVSVVVEPVAFDPISVNVAPVTVAPISFQDVPITIEAPPVTVEPPPDEDQLRPANFFEFGQPVQQTEIRIADSFVLPGGDIKLSLQATNESDAELGISSDLGGE